MIECSCGNVEHHTIARRETADGSVIYVWHDGTLTEGAPGKLGYIARGFGMPRSKYARDRRRKAVFLVMGDIELFDRHELPALIKAAEKTFRYDWRSMDDQRRAAVRNVKVVS